MEKIPDSNFLASIFGATVFSDENQANTFVTGDPKTPCLSRPELKRFIEGLPGMLGEPYSLAWEAEESRAALAILATFAICSRDARAVSRYSGVPLSAVKRYFQRLLENGILGVFTYPRGKV